MAVPLSDNWRKWLTYNINHGSDKDKLLKQALAQGFDKDEVTSIIMRNVTRPLEGIGPQPQDEFFKWARPKFVTDTTKKIAWKIDTDLCQMYEIPEFLTESECKLIINEINQHLVKSTVTGGDNYGYRTSRTCYLKTHNNVLSENLDERICDLFGVTDDYSEGMQGVRYDVGEYFKMHTDYFEEGTKGYESNTKPGGQRTWTFMIYLNSPIKGGHTYFRDLGRSFAPVTGTALVWNNLYPTGDVNPFTHHEALPVEEGNKWIITKWLRSQTGRNKL